VVARIIYPTGEVALVGHEDGHVARRVFDQAAFNVDQTLSRVEKKARLVAREAFDTVLAGWPPKR
jgi:hypothetical protein